MWERVSSIYSSSSSSSSSSGSNHEEATRAVVAGDSGTEKGWRALGKTEVTRGGHALAAEQAKQAEQEVVVRFEMCSSGQGGAVVVTDGRAVVRRPLVDKKPAPPPRWCSKL